MLENRVMEYYNKLGKEKCHNEALRREISYLKDQVSVFRCISKARDIMVGVCPTCGHIENATIAEAEAKAKYGDVISLLESTLDCNKDNLIKE
jgi:hypothetical protein